MGGGIRVLEHMLAAVQTHRARALRRRYLREAPRPTHSLLFLLGLAVLYEIGVMAVTRGAGPGRELLVPSVIQGLLQWAGIVGHWVPAAVLVSALLIWHRLRHDHWRVRGWVLLVMVPESLLLTAPLLVLSALFGQAGAAAGTGWQGQLVSALGAGAYEELVFRMLLISGLAWVLREFVRLRGPAAVGAAVVLASVLFAQCHFAPLGWQPFGWGAFWFHLVAGLYLSVVYLGRGLGVAGGCHAAYNLLLVCLRAVTAGG